MLTHPLMDRLRGLGLAAMADAFVEMQNNTASSDLTREDWLGLLLDREVTARDNKRLGRRLSHARLRQSAVVEDADFRTQRGLDRALFHKLAGCDWIRQSQHLVICGPTGVGKSWLACALGHKACREGFSVLYRRAPRLFAELATARGEGRLPRLLAMLERTRLLIIDGLALGVCHGGVTDRLARHASLPIVMSRNAVGARGAPRRSQARFLRPADPYPAMCHADSCRS
jgi:DNA replication protein DnaC